MKCRRFFALRALVGVSSAALCLSDQAATQPDAVRPVVSIAATVPLAAEAGPSIGVFTVNRTGSTDLPLTVYYVLGGSAKNGEDYEPLPNSVTIPAQALSAKIVVKPIDDLLVEDTESVEVKLDYPPTLNPLPPLYEIGSPAQAVVTIADNDPGPATRPNLVIAEPKAGQVYAAPVDILIQTTAFDPAGAILYVEYFDGEQMIGHSQIATFAVPQPGELWHHSFLWKNAPIGSHALTARATDSRGGPVKSEPVNIKVVTGPLPPVVSVTATTAATREPDAFTKVMPGRFTIVRTGSTDQPLAVYFKLGGTAQNGPDYALLDEQVTIPAGESSADVIVAPIDDKLVEGDETVVLKLTWPVMSILEGLPAAGFYTVGEPGQATVVIFDNDTLPATQAKLVINEPQDGQVFIAPTDVTIRVTTTDPQGYISRVELFDGDQKIGEAAIDFIRAPDPGTPIDLELLWEQAPLGFHTIISQAVDTQGAVVKSDPVQILVAETYVPTVVTVTAPDPEAWERNPLTKIMDNPGVFKVTRKGYTERALNVFYKLSGTAQNGVDYEKLPGWVTIPAGETAAEIVVQALDDLLVEGPEKVVLTLTGPPLTGIEPTLDSYEVGDPSEAVVWILDNDVSPVAPPIVTVTAPDPEASEVDPNSRCRCVPDTGLFRVSRTGLTDLPLAVLYELGGTAQNGMDYTKLPRYVVIPVGASSADITVEPLPDNLVEGDETVILTLVSRPPGESPIQPLSPAPYVVGTPSQAVVVIHDRDISPIPPATIVITQPRNGQAFSAPADIDIKLTTIDPKGYIAGVELFDGGQKIGEAAIDFFRAPDPGTPIDLEFLWRNAPIGSHSLIARSADNQGKLVQSEPVAITVLETPPLLTVVTVTAPDPVAVEANPILSSVQPDTATFRVTRTGATDQPLTVYYKLSGDAINGVDYLKLPEEVTILQGESSADIGLLAVEDNLVEGTETVVLTLEDPVCAAVVPPPPGCYAVGEPGQAMVVIRDKDTGANLPPKVLITHPHDGQTFAAPADIKIAAEARDPDGWVGKMEFFANGNKLGEVVVNFEQTPPPGETQAFTFSWSNVAAGEYVLTAVGTDDKGFTGKSNPVTINVADSQHLPIVTVFATDPFASERGPNTATFKVRRTGSANEPLTVGYSLGGTAENGVDYAKLDGLVTIPAGSHSASIIVQPIDDAQDEPIETVVIKLEPAVPSSLYEVGRPAKAVAVIAGDDRPRQKVTAFAEALHFNLPGANGSIYRVETSDDLKTWVPVFSGVVTDGAVNFTDPDSAGLNHRFYRVAPEIASVADDD